jgi:hypothetical protein
MKEFLGTVMGMGVGALAVAGCAVLTCLCLCGGIIIAIGAGRQAQTEELIALNGGRGSRENPLPAGGSLNFEAVEVRALRVIRPANDQIFRAPAVGNEWVLVEWSLTCKVQDCDGIQLGARLIDVQGQDWGQPIVLELNNHIAGQSAIQGNTARGVMPFEFPAGRGIDLFMVSWAGGPDLYLDY